VFRASPATPLHSWYGTIPVPLPFCTTLPFSYLDVTYAIQDKKFLMNRKGLQDSNGLQETLESTPREVLRLVGFCHYFFQSGTRIFNVLSLEDGCINDGNEMAIPLRNLTGILAKIAVLR
jgi:hypothetical protein